MFVVFLLPFIFIPVSWNPYEFPAFIFFVVGVQFLFVVFLAKGFKEKSLSRFLNFDSLTVVIILYIFVVFVADVLGMDPRISLLGSIYRHQGFVLLLSCFIFYCLVRDLVVVKKNTSVFLHIFIYGLFTSVFLLCLIALWQAFAIYDLHLLSIPTYQGRIIGTFGNANFLGGYLATVLPFVLWHRWRMRWKLLLAGMIICTILLSGSRGGLLATGIVLLLFFSTKIRNKITSRNIFFFLGVFVVVIILLIKQNSYWQRVSQWDNRQIIWQAGVESVSKRPLLGVGQENFELIFPKERRMKVDSAHNIFLEVAVSSGAGGLLLFILIIALAFRQASTVVKVALIAFLISALFNPLAISQIVFFWLLLALSHKNIRWGFTE